MKRTKHSRLETSWFSNRRLLFVGLGNVEHPALLFVRDGGGFRILDRKLANQGCRVQSWEMVFG
jgi:hypothetical protein